MENDYWQYPEGKCEKCGKSELYRVRNDVQRYKRLFTWEFDTKDAYRLIDKIADSGVFQLARRVSFTYHVDGYDIPGGWEKLMGKYYDVMYRGCSFATAKKSTAHLFHQVIKSENKTA